VQRWFQQYAGVAPTWVLRRYRLLDAAEAVRDGGLVDWAALAAELGYADQAHLIRDFRAAVGEPPAAYARAQRPVGGQPAGP
jgi:AraC-like DNA-binding protein